MHIFITGGAGFIGSHLVELHLARGDKVHVVDDLSTGSMDNIARFMDSPNFRFDQADMLVWPLLERTAGWADRVYHLAAVVGVYRVLAEPTKVLAVNIAACERLLRAVNANNPTRNAGPCPAVCLIADHRCRHSGFAVQRHEGPAGPEPFERHSALLGGGYRTGRDKEIVVRDPRRRLVSAPPCRDRCTPAMRHALLAGG